MILKLLKKIVDAADSYVSGLEGVERRRERRFVGSDPIREEWREEKEG